MTKKRGRKPKPAALKLIEGNRGKRPIEPEIDAPPVNDLTCPEHLTGYAAEAWNYYAPKLKPLKLLSELDVQALIALCRAFQRWRQAEDQLDTLGDDWIIETTKGTKQISPLVRESRQLSKTFFDYLSSFGLTPAARAGLKIDLPTGGEGNNGRFEGILD